MDGERREEVERELDRVPLLVDPRTGKPISRREVRRRDREERTSERRARSRRRKTCERAECDGPREKKLGNGLRVCRSCWQDAFDGKE